MIYGSVCSGIEAASVAWEPLGWKARFLSEIEDFPSAVLNHHWPNVPNHGDMTKFKEWPDDPIDLLVGGTPCQSFSVAGLRKGLDDPRGNLMLTFGAIAARYRPTWLVWENVPGVLSSNGGRDFGAFLWMLGELGYGFSYRVLDAQYFGVAQRRRRVFVVGHLGDWRRAAAVLFERHSLSGDTAPSREAKTDAAGTITAGAGRRRGAGINPSEIVVDKPVAALTANGVGTCGADDNQAQAGHLIKGHRMAAFGEYADDETASAMKARDYKDATDLVVHGTQDTCVSKNLAFALGRNNGQENAITHPIHDKATRHKGMGGLGAGNGLGIGDQTDPSFTLTTGDKHAVAIGGNISHTLRGEGFDASEDGTGRGTPVIATPLVRRLTPIECERLQGFPDGHTQIPWKGKPADQCPDGPRYKAVGNSMAVPVMAWIGQRIKMVESL